jgi:hypothetical protein
MGLSSINVFNRNSSLQYNKKALKSCVYTAAFILGNLSALNGIFLAKKVTLIPGQRLTLPTKSF